MKGEDLVGELVKSLYGARKTAHNWEKKWQHVLIEMNFEIGSWSSAIVCCCEREVCGFFHWDDFMFVEESMQWAWTKISVQGEADSQEGKRFLVQTTTARRSRLGRLVTWEIEITVDPKHREILLAEIE